MNIEEYIKSGILESYLAGDLSEAEMLKVDEMAEMHPEIKEELNELRKSLNDFAETNEKKPAQSILSEALKAIREDEKEAFLTSIEEPARGTRSINLARVWSIAASILLLISAGFNYVFYSEFSDVREQLRLAQRDNETLVSKVNDQDLSLQYADLRIAHFLNKDNIHIRMDGLNLAPDSFANVFWNAKTNAVFISVDNLPEPPHGHQYQLWAIKPGLPPIDAGIFEHNLLIQELKVIRGNVEAFAVTLEKEGGSPIATVDKTYVKGFLKKS